MDPMADKPRKDQPHPGQLRTWADSSGFLIMVMSQFINKEYHYRARREREWWIYVPALAKRIIRPTSWILDNTVAMSDPE
jgi:hypothetical protein